ncbi:hypothetical protein Pmani_010472 [Petrolisthes manimaculis]|uniref:Uncharacterized protein n=1 Tax=Petrolisthes manimaculis TaxID=1843537 RepID=A0AAE1UFI4_9EUCA|nr:hypothetical protein Pmani_010472 [Petrolisthes manimaculis]
MSRRSARTTQNKDGMRGEGSADPVNMDDNYKEDQSSNVNTRENCGKCDQPVLDEDLAVSCEEEMEVKLDDVQVMVVEGKNKSKDMDTRFRGDTTGNTLDLLFSNDDSVVEDIRLESPLGRSDHGCIYFKCDMNYFEEKRKKQVYMFEKGDYEMMKKKLNSMNWSQYISQELTIEGKWTRFCGRFKEIID